MTPYQQDAYDMISEGGSPVTLARVTSTYSPGSGQTTITSVTAEATVAVNFPSTKNRRDVFDVEIQDALRVGTMRYYLIARGDTSVLVAPGTLMEVNGKVWEVKGTTPLSPDGTDIYYATAVTESSYTTIPVTP